MIETFPHDSNARVLATLKGGIGDVLMIAAACSPRVREFVFCVEEFQIPLLEKVPGCTPKPFQYFRDNRLKSGKFDAVMNFMFFLSNGYALKSGDYYSQIEKRIGASDSVELEFDIKHNPIGGIYVHMSASNPNRDWLRDRWEKLIPELAKLDKVYLLGRACEFQVRGDNITVLSDESDDLLWQAKKLSTAKQFIGVDSGFAHIAGLTRVPGHILCFNTLPSDVIGRYPTLSGIHKFGDNIPSRSCKVPCAVSDKYKQALSVEDTVLEVQKAYNLQ